MILSYFDYVVCYRVFISYWQYGIFSTVIYYILKYWFSISICFSTYTNYYRANTTILQFVDTKIGVYIYLTFVSAMSSTKAPTPI